MLPTIETPAMTLTAPPQRATPIDSALVMPRTMKAIVCPTYGSPDTLELAEIETPEPTDDTVVIRVRAASVNAVDWHRMRGAPYFMRATDGLRRPKEPRLGADVAGRVEAVGANVTNLEPGDEVFGMSLGTFAEFVRVSAEGVVPKPANLTFEQAGAIAVAATTALQGLRDKGGIEPGQRVLIVGAGGGVGHFAVQIAKALGANVTGVTSAANVAMVRSLGADAVVDYEAGDFTRSGQRYDLIFDASGHQSLGALRRALTPDGTLVICGAGRGDWVGPLARVVKGAVWSRFGRQQLRPFLAHRERTDLLTIKELIEAGKVAPVIDRTYPFSEIREAIRHLETGLVRGKVVVTF
jgi:NADPH:quinone reductase-like Zn-dependent oxidoreductase